MSKKTENIYKEIENLKLLQEKLQNINSSLQSREIDDIQFAMSQSVKNLQFLISSLYSYNGKSTSYAKKTSSRENGKKGGRPPKRVTEIKKRILELNQLIPEIEHQLKFTDDTTEEQNLKQQLENYTAERDSLSQELISFKK